MNRIRRFVFVAAAMMAAGAWPGMVAAQTADAPTPSEVSNFAFPIVAGESLSLPPEGKAALRKTEDRQIKELRDLEDKYYGDLRALREKHYRERTEIKKQYVR
jgi:hypothetical protein